jgi:hypothetical protein
MQNPVGLSESTTEELADYDAEGISFETEDGERPILNPPQLELIANCQSELARDIPDQCPSPNHCIDLDLRAVDIIQHYSNNS